MSLDELNGGGRCVTYQFFCAYVAAQQCFLLKITAPKLRNMACLMFPRRADAPI
jgi:hypothetical protein